VFILKVLTGELSVSVDSKGVAEAKFSCRHGFRVLFGVFGRGFFLIAGVRNGVAEDFVPFRVAVGDEDFLSDSGESLEDEGTEIGEGGRRAFGEATSRSEIDQAGEVVIEIMIGADLAGHGGEFGGDGFGLKHLALFASMAEAEGRVAGRDGEAARAAVGEGELAVMAGTCFVGVSGHRDLTR
jgi:hypothetical protein